MYAWSIKELTKEDKSMNIEKLKVKIGFKEYIELKNCKAFLDSLENNGVDNWEWYVDAYDDVEFIRTTGREEDDEIREIIRELGVEIAHEIN